MKADQLAELIVVTVKRAIDAALDGAKVRGRFEAMELRITELEGAPRLKYLGKFEDGRTYVVGHAVSRGGTLWICQAPNTRGVPGTDFVGWRLAVKRGHVEQDAEVSDDTRTNLSLITVSCSPRTRASRSTSPSLRPATDWRLSRPRAHGSRRRGPP